MFKQKSGHKNQKNIFFVWFHCVTLSSRSFCTPHFWSESFGKWINFMIAIWLLWSFCREKCWSSPCIDLEYPPLASLWGVDKTAHLAWNIFNNESMLLLKSQPRHKSPCFIFVPVIAVKTVKNAWLMIYKATDKYHWQQTGAYCHLLPNMKEYFEHLSLVVWLQFICCPATSL